MSVAMSAPTARHRTVIVGASIAGIRCASALRQQGYRGQIVVIGDEPDEPYDRPPLSKQFLLGAWDSTRILLPKHDGVGGDIDVRLECRAEQLDSRRSTITLSSGEVLAYDNAVIATGARATTSPWGLPTGSHVLRTRAHSAQLRADLAAGKELVVVGGGLIGCEVAATAVSLGIRTTIVDAAPEPPVAVFGESVGRELIGLHERAGITLEYGVGVESFRVAGSSGRITAVRTTDDRSLPADVVLVAIGARPNTEWLEGSGLDITDGVLCDDFGRATGVDNVFAVGDVARWFVKSDEIPRRTEHWTAAIEQASTVAAYIADPSTAGPRCEPSYFWTDQCDWKVHVVGTRAPTDSEALVGDPATGSFAAVSSDSDSRLTAVVSVNWPRALSVGREGLLRGDPGVHTATMLEDLSQPTRRRVGTPLFASQSLP
jgi:NADPH-dependent 2,4-dienoyl-CoA reductase/sulfur reductase-like enzyme